MKILIVEDEKELLSDLTNFFLHQNFICTQAKSVVEAQEKVYMYDYDIIVLDLGLPDGNGLEVLKYVKEIKKKAGVLILSAKGALDDKIKGLDIGADDYLTKPFHLPELNSRVRSIIRRKSFDGDDLIKFAELTVNLNQREVAINNMPLSLTQKEYELLLFFISNKNRVLTRQSIVEHLWGDDTDMFHSFDFVYSHIKNLRKKIIDAKGSNYISTVYGVGYKFEEQ